MRRAALIYNPTAGRGRWQRVLAAVLRTCRREGVEVDPMPTAAAGQATDLAGELAREGRVEAVFALGGDGTAREVAAGLLGGEAPLGILPGGTANLLALALGLPRDPVAAAAVLCRAPSRSFDVGLAGGRPFLMMSSAGLDARALAALDRGWKARLGKTAVFLQGVREWWRYGYPAIEVTADGEQLAPATFVAVANIPHFAGNFHMAPGARTDDRRLELVTFHGTGRRPTLGFILGVVTGRHLRRRDVRLRSVEEVILTVPPEAGVQLDGDPLLLGPADAGSGAGEAPVPVRLRVCLAPAALQVLAPALTPA